MLTYDVQLAHFKPDQIEDRGFVNETEAREALARFPFQEELSKLKESEDGCLPTITFKDADNNSYLAFWIDDTGKFTMDGKLKRRRFGKEQFTESPDTLAKILTYFIKKDPDGINEVLGDHGSFWQFLPPPGFFIFFEGAAFLLAYGTFIFRFRIADLLLHNPTSFVSFVCQLFLANVIIGLVIWLFSNREP